MGQVLIRGIDEDVLERLRKRAEGNHRSFEGELRDILERASRQVDLTRARALADEMRRQFACRIQSDSTDLIREDRDR